MGVTKAFCHRFLPHQVEVQRLASSIQREDMVVRFVSREETTSLLGKSPFENGQLAREYVNDGKLPGYLRTEARSALLVKRGERDRAFLHQHHLSRHHKNRKSGKAQDDNRMTAALMRTADSATGIRF